MVLFFVRPCTLVLKDESRGTLARLGLLQLYDMLSILGCAPLAHHGDRQSHTKHQLNTT